LSRRAAAAGVAAAALLLAGCGAHHNPEELRLERSHLAWAVRELRVASGPIAREVAAAKDAWPLIAGGLHNSTPAEVQSRVSRAAALAREVPTPAIVRYVHELTGPAAGIVTLIESFTNLVGPGWQVTAFTVHALRHGPTRVARFMNANAAVYLYAIYDSHFNLGQIGKSVAEGYEKLGGRSAFGRSLTPAQVLAVVRAYSPEADRLSPHPPPQLEI
jgi:hypothetical protein